MGPPPDTREVSPDPARGPRLFCLEYEGDDGQITAVIVHQVRPLDLRGMGAEGWVRLWDWGCGGWGFCGAKSAALGVGVRWVPLRWVGALGAGCAAVAWGYHRCQLPWGAVGGGPIPWNKGHHSRAQWVPQGWGSVGAVHRGPAGWWVL